MEPGATSGAVLSVEGLGARIAGRQVLDGVDFAVAPGEFTGLIGSNGAGKTTLFRAILGLQGASSGQILVDGRPRTRRTDSIGYVPQKFLLDPDLPLRGRDLVGLGLDARRPGFTLNRRRRADRVEEMLAAVGAESFADTRVGKLSGGEQQRILIAHALISRPRLLLADEPLANLDLRSAQEVVALLAGICRERGVAVLISAHEINALLPVMDRVVYLAGGRAASGSSEEVIRADVLSGLYGHHVDVIDVHGRVLIVAGAGDDADLVGCEETVEHGLAADASELRGDMDPEKSEAPRVVP
ncbi:MAG TPA: metal ABC transporter ATP-binding protein [Solirubrobacterales bacterium]|jgi:zinc/manganese transport system ATP-binding protein|nr:metal ABC transporter ATP-binding protein [Solirubrobacterales bacterium]